MKKFLDIFVPLAVCISALMVAVPVQAKTDNLMKQAADRVVGSGLTADDIALLRLLSDGDTKTAPTPITQPLELVLDLGDVHSIENLIVHLPKSRARGAAAKVELLGSIASADSGYQVLRSGTINLNRGNTRLKFLPTAARWLMIRLTPNPKAKRVAVAEIEVIGQPGPPQNKYAFQDSPASAQRVLTLMRDTLSLDVSESEHSLFRDAADGKLDEWSLADAAILASGVSDDADRDRLRARFAKLEQEATRKLAKTKGTMKRGQLLLKLLHGKVFRAGYKEKQTDVSVLLDKGTYNCVSSAVVYAIVAKRVGLDVRGIEVPDHAFAIVYDGTAFADVETTTKAGFNPARNPNARKAFTKQTGFAYIPGSNASKRRETSALGLIALIYYNHGVGHSKAKRHERALLSYYRALSLDPKLISAVKNSLASLGRWAEESSQSGDHERAIGLLSTGLKLAPEDRTLRHNRRVVWQRRIADAIENKPFDDVIALTQAAHSNDPKAGFDRQQAQAFISRGRGLVAKGEWSQALATVSDGVSKVNKASLAPLNRYRAGIVLNWMSTAIRDRDWPTALTAAREGQKALPGDWRVQRNAAYLLQEWSESEFKRGGADAGIAAVDAVLQVYPKNNSVRRAARSFVLRRIAEFRKKGMMDEAAAAVDKYAVLLKGRGETDRLHDSLLIENASKSMKARDWATAAAIYEKARQEGGDKKLRSYQQNVGFIAQEWLKESGDSADADAIATDLLARFADVRKMPSIVAAHFQRLIKAKITAKEFDAAVETADRGRQIVGDTTPGKKLVRYAYDQWANHHQKQKQWQQAVDVYDTALTAWPRDSHLKRNAIATWHAWAKPHLDRKEWAKAVEVYERGLKRIPNANLFKQNIKYCKQQLSR